MSACTYSDSVGSDSATAVPASTEDDELTTTLAPRSARRRTVASPIPLEDPVTIATLSSSLSIPARLLRCPAAEPTLRAVHVFLETERLILRRFTADDEDLLFELDNDPDVMLYINGGAPVPRAEIVDETIPAFLSYYDRFDGYGFWAVVEKESGRFLGWFHFRPGEGAGPLEPELGLPVAPVRLEQGIRLRRCPGADRPGIRRVRCRAGLRRDHGRATPVRDG